jgi:hypothetical protein
MQFTPWHRYLFRVIVGTLFIVWGVAELLLDPSGESIVPTILLAAGLAFLLAGVLRWRKYGNTPEKDERTRRIGAWGLSYSWILSLFFMTALFMLDYLGMLVLTVQAALGVSIAVMALSAVGFQVYLSRAGDVE